MDSNWPVLTPPRAGAGGPTGLPTPPDSPRKRRLVLRESDEVEGELSIETYIYRSDPYRSTTMHSPWPYPLLVEDAPEEITAQVMAYGYDIWQLVRDYHPSFDRSNCAVGPVQMSKRGYGTFPKIVLLVSIRFIHVPPIRGSLRDALHSLLQRKGLPDIEVEVVHRDYCFNPQLFSIIPSHTAVTTYEQSHGRLVHLLERYIKSAWVSLCLFEVGRTRDKSTPTIVVTVLPGTTFDWSRLSYQILAEVNASTTGIGVEFLPGEIGTLLSPSGVDHLLQNITHDTRLRLGTSISVRGEQGGGTLGGFFKLRHGSTTYRGFLTNYHVVRPPADASDSVKLKSDRFGSLFTADATQQDVIHFAPQHRNQCLQKVSSNLSGYENHLKKFNERIEMRQTCGMEVNRTLLDHRDTSKALVDDAKRQELNLQSIPLKKIGKTLASSGNGFFRGRFSDWAFVVLDPDVADGDNTLPAYPYTTRGSFYTAGNVPQSFGELAKGQLVYKVGCATGITAGICNGVTLTSHWDVIARTRHHQGVTRQLPSVTEEFVIVGHRGLESSPQDETDFCGSGDSGSLIINDIGDVCGLLYGSFNTRSQGAAGLAMTMPDVLAAIQTKGGELMISE